MYSKIIIFGVFYQGTEMEDRTGLIQGSDSDDDDKQVSYYNPLNTITFCLMLTSLYKKKYSSNEILYNLDSNSSMIPEEEDR
jgi:hypothetical protein